MAHYVFDFKGTNRTKFLRAGQNYVLKVLRLNRDKAILIIYLENNFSEVCEDGCSKGFCTGTCKNCPIQEAHTLALKELAMRTENITVTYNRCTFNEVPACERMGKTWAEMRRELSK